MSEPTITRPRVKIYIPAAGFYALNGESVLQSIPNQEKERICTCFEEIREQNPGRRILLVLGNFSYICAHKRKRGHQPGVDLVFLPVRSPDLSSIEQV